MTYVKSAQSPLQASASFVHGNLSILSSPVGKEQEESSSFAVIHKHYVTIGPLGGDQSVQQCLRFSSKSEDRDSSSCLTQVSSL